MLSDWVSGGATIVAVVVGALLSVYVRGQQKLKISEKRLDAYASLWELTKPLRRGGPDLTDDEFHELATKMTDWYYEPGGGMLATAITVGLFVKLRGNLTCADAEFYPESWTDLMEPLAPGETALQRRQGLLGEQFSILRTQMKMDCSIYYGRQVSPYPLAEPYETDLLRELGSPVGWAWRGQIRRAKKETKAEYLRTRLGVSPT